MLSIIFPILLLSMLATMIVISLGYHYTAKLFPLLVMLPVAALLVAQIFIAIRDRKKQKTVAKEGKPPGEVTFAKFLQSQAWIVALLLLIYLLGFIVGPSLFVLIYLKTHGVKWITTIICIALVISVVYGAFGLFFEVYLYEGLLFS